MLRDTSCDVTTPEGKFIFVAKIPVTPNINEDPEKVQALLKNFNRLDQHQLLEANDGVYNWLLYSSTGDPTIKFICTEVVSPFEIGTRHQALAFNSRTDVDKIYGGGEIYKTGSTIEYNLLSGTYSHPLVRYNFSKNRKVTADIKAAFMTFVPTATYTDDEETGFMSKIKVVKNSVLELYKAYGYTVLLFDDAATCYKFNTDYSNIEWRFKYYSKQLKEAEETHATSPTKDSDINVSVLRKLYMESIEHMLEILKPHLKKSNNNKAGGKRQTRRRRR
jgi:hypothetical protein